MKEFVLIHRRSHFANLKFSPIVRLPGSRFLGDFLIQLEEKVV